MGNSFRRIDHNLHGFIVSNPILDRLLKKIYPDDATLVFGLKSEILPSIFSHEEEDEYLNIEAGAAKIGEGTSMIQGRSRIPYLTGKVDIHSLSAL